MCADVRGLEVRHDQKSLSLMPDRLLEEVLLAGTPPAFESLAGWEFNGYNTGDLAFAIRKFRKGFYKDTDLPESELGGYNVNIKQSRLAEPWEPVIKGGKPQRHSYYRAYRVRADEKDNLYPNALLLNYDSPRTPKWNPASLLRDYLVQVYPDKPDLLLGKAYVALPFSRLFISFFVLERACRG